MPTMQDSATVGANAVSANLLAGLLYEFLPAQAAIRLACTGAATGLRTTFLVGGVSLINDQAIGLQNRFPIIPDDIMGEFGGDSGDRLILTFRNTTGAGIVVFWRVDVDF